MITMCVYYCIAKELFLQILMTDSTVGPTVLVMGGRHFKRT